MDLDLYQNTCDEFYAPPQTPMEFLGYIMYPNTVSGANVCLVLKVCMDKTTSLGTPCCSLCCFLEKDIMNHITIHPVKETIQE